MSNNLAIEIEINQEYFKTQDQVGSAPETVSGTPLKVGFSHVRAVLKGTLDPETGRLTHELATHLEASAKMEISDPIELSPQVSVFPWDPMTKPRDQVSYQVIGLSSSLSQRPTTNFFWSSLNSSLVTVTQVWPLIFFRFLFVKND